MLSFFKKLFGRSEAQVVAPESTTKRQAPQSAIMRSVEVAHLSLAAILDRLPDELKPLVLVRPEDTVTVALPIATIVKQLPGGAVKVSLATLHRQAPAGILGPLPPGDKRMVEVPLAEVFRHIKPSVFKRRPDQKPSAAMESSFNLFGDSANPYQIAPTTPDDEPDPAPSPAANSPLTMQSAPASEMAAPADESEPAFRLAPPPPSTQRVIAAPTNLFGLKPATPPPAPQSTDPAVSGMPPLSVPVAPLCGAWPEEIRSELAVLNGSAHLALPAAEVTAGLARGRVTFKWGQLRGWLEPALDGPSAADESTELTLPLKVVAPLFLAATKKPKAEQKPAFETDIPALFSGGQAVPVAPETVVTEEAAPVEIEETSEALEESFEAAAEPVDVIELEDSAPLAEEPQTIPFTLVEAPVEVAEHEAEPEPMAVVQPPQTVGELFGEPEKTEWTPAEIVAHLAKLPSISGAVVALQEGLLVAHSLPPDVKSEVIAAFLPQLFARLNQYSSEMKLGEVDDLLFTTHGAHCQIYRLGYVYFGVLGHPGQPLPWTELRLVADELARQTQQKS